MMDQKVGLPRAMHVLYLQNPSHAVHNKKPVRENLLFVLLSAAVAVCA